ncbi:hypothetical protein QKW35_07095 [Pontibacterium granulatum]|uniref:hypothetical protein n=1 Tax=Pontibacterium granulatum TaxID=2036029 RepID=UPI00249BB909|nr:hypothetical protein [Pontibacterium granulatum]MDI3324140.1 hypothetical protein [Pontibacterium granulatum]
MIMPNPVRLTEENAQYSGTGGVSEGNTHAGFIPAFMDTATGQVELSRFSNGRIAPCHLLDGLPESWITCRDLRGRVQNIKSTVISGFVRLEQFFTREEAARFISGYS